MNDIEDQVFAQLAKALRNRFPGIHVTGEFTMKPAKFPHVSIVQEDSYVPRDLSDTSETERYSEIMFEISAYSNKAGKKKSECKEIISAADDWMYRHNFRRYSLFPVPNMDSTIYRIVGRYRAVTDGQEIYRR